ncbi:hypothetical protein PR048_007364 [Dryococelus australis]|uniref:Tc1-like transposase DDE domain-containing protein n=1 Tax=Dryococelus australis TaxID=614101 RepID=A0ABQ9HU05_9NEOP|nr:hypothetical protein PR048_007364 [Dryococelus australis]
MPASLCASHGMAPETRLASHQTILNTFRQACGDAPVYTHVGIVPEDAAGRWVFSGISRFSRPCVPALLHTHLASPSSALKTSISWEPPMKLDEDGYGSAAKCKRGVIRRSPTKPADQRHLRHDLLVQKSGEDSARNRSRFIVVRASDLPATQSRPPCQQYTNPGTTNGSTNVATSLQCDKVVAETPARCLHVQGTILPYKYIKRPFTGYRGHTNNPPIANQGVMTTLVLEGVHQLPRVIEQSGSMKIHCPPKSNWAPLKIVDLCFTAFGVGSLVFVRGSMNTGAYCNILDNEMLPTLWRYYGMDPCYFQDDNARCHVSRATMQWYADNNVRRLDWPTQSPDLNPIEKHLWDELDRWVRARQARPKSIAQLMEWFLEECACSIEVHRHIGGAALLSAGAVRCIPCPSACLPACLPSYTQSTFLRPPPHAPSSSDTSLPPCTLTGTLYLRCQVTCLGRAVCRDPAEDSKWPERVFSNINIPVHKGIGTCVKPAPQNGRVSTESVIEARYLRQDCTPVQCFGRRCDERVAAHGSVAPSDTTRLGLRPLIACAWLSECAFRLIGCCVLENVPYWLVSGWRGDTSQLELAPMRVIEASMEQHRNEGRGKSEISEKTRLPTASSGTIITCENPDDPALNRKMPGAQRKKIPANFRLESDVSCDTAFLHLIPHYFAGFLRYGFPSADSPLLRRFLAIRLSISLFPITSQVSCDTAFLQLIPHYVAGFFRYGFPTADSPLLRRFLAVRLSISLFPITSQVSCDTAFLQLIPHYFAGFLRYGFPTADSPLLRRFLAILATVCRSAALSATIPMCNNPGATPPGIQPGLPRRETSGSFTASPPEALVRFSPRVSWTHASVGHGREHREFPAS